MVTAHLTHIAAALPPPIHQRAMWDECFSDRYAALPGAQRIWNAAGIETRHAVVDPRHEDLSAWSTGERMSRFLPEAMPLAKRAISAALCDAGLNADDIELFVVVSCTGYATPGLDVLLAHELGMSPEVQRLCLGHMGCYAALPGLRTVSDAVVARGVTALMLCVELTSLHVQPPSRDVGQLVSHALFSDAAVAAIVQHSRPGLRVVDVVALTDASHRESMTWHITDRGFRMTLSPRVPSILAVHVRPTVEGLLRRHNLDVADVAGWAIHPGGPRILDVCATALDLDDNQMAPSSDTLRDHGNCSSATIMMVLDRLLTTGLKPGDNVVALAFGPGLSLYAALLHME